MGKAPVVALAKAPLDCVLLRKAKVCPEVGVKPF
jgi:hypothetical protein